jgi:chorismate mutase
MLRYYKQIIDANINDLSLTDCRNGIDEIDDLILDLLGKRTQIVKRVGEYKTHQGENGKVFIRPGREASMLRNLIERSIDHTSYSPEAITRIWRAIISSSVDIEQSLRIMAHIPPTENNDTYWLAREYFGSTLTNIKTASDAKSLIDLVVSDYANIGVLSITDKNQYWWKYFAEISDKEQLKIFVRLPFSHTPTFAMAKIDPEPTDDAVSLWVVENSIKEKIDTWQKVLKVLKKYSTNKVSLLQRHKDTILLEINGYWIDKNDKNIQTMAKQGIKITPIGAYAKSVI